MVNEKIDFVIPWVDSNDPEWYKDKMIHSEKKIDESNSNIRFRDWENLKYWFRSVEKYANWVNKIYFITYGHLPSWLNVKNKKLVIVNHKDYILNDVLPTFSANPIELSLNNIKGLSEYFVYFNDDMFITDYVKSEYFFKKGLPRDGLIFNNVAATKENVIINHIVLNDLELLSREFSKKKVIKSNFRKVFSLKNGKNIIRTLCTLPWKDFTGVYNQHVPISFLKSTFDEVWKNYNDELSQTLKNKFRSKYDYNVWVMRYWQLFSGKFVVKNFKKDKYFNVENDTSIIENAIKKRKYKLICINDSDPNLDFDSVKRKINSAFEYALSKKSSFEL